MRFRPLAVLLLPAALAIPFTSLAAPVNPHGSDDGCLSCHIGVPTPEEAAVEIFHLVRESVDETCRTCHAEHACALGVNQTTHPSNLEIRDFRTGSGPHPTTLPLRDGKIVCTTCHQPMVQAENGYKRVRKAHWVDGQPDLAAFCADCHTEG